MVVASGLGDWAERSGLLEGVVCLPRQRDEHHIFLLEMELMEECE